MKARPSPETLQKIRKELGDDRVIYAVESRDKLLRDLDLAHDRLKNVERALAYHRSIGNVNEVAKRIGEKLFAETLIETYKRRLRECHE